MGQPEFDKSQIDILCGFIVKHEKTAASAQKELSRLKSELQTLEMRPSADEMVQQVRERTEAFLTCLDDTQERKRFNNWVNTLGVTLTIIDGKTMIIDQTKEDAAVLGVDLGII